jgi:hypothetical protein
MMKKFVVKAILAGLTVVFVASDATAWGVKTQNTITSTAIQVIRRTFPDTFRTPEILYDDDVYRGAAADPGSLSRSGSFTNDREAILAISSQIQLLRAVREYGIDSYWCYRMGILSTLVSEVMAPFGLGSATGSQVSLKQRVDSDIEAHIARYSFAPSKDVRTYVRDVPSFFQDRRSFIADNLKVITLDYAQGRGYDGFLKGGGEEYFGRSVEAVSDIWFTILRVQGDVGDMRPTGEVLTEYFVNQIDYLLGVRKNRQQADKVYQFFRDVNKTNMVAYERVGDLYFAYGENRLATSKLPQELAEGQSAREQGVEEWKRAYNTPGPHRASVSRKLANYYLVTGDALFEKGMKPGSLESDLDLPSALEHYKKVLEYDRGSSSAAKKISETNTAIVERNERLQLVVGIIASGEKTILEADKASLAGDYGTAMATYKQAQQLLDVVDDEFPDQGKTARDKSKEANKKITEVINSILNSASEAISRGNEASNQKRFPDAMSEYAKVADIVKVIPEDNPANADNKKSMVDQAQKAMKDAEDAKKRFEDQQRAREEAAKKAARQ